MLNKKDKLFKYSFSDTEIDTFILDSEKYLLFEDFVTLIIDTNNTLSQTYNNGTFSVLISKYTKDNRLIHSELLNLPLPKETDFDSLLQNFSKNKPPKTKNPPKKKVDYISNDKNKETDSINRKRVAYFVLLGIFSLSTAIQQIQIHNIKVENQSLQSQIAEAKKIPSQNSKIDTFSRFFLSSYFSSNRNNEVVYQEKLNKYVAINTSKWETPKGNLEQVYGLDIKHNDSKVTEVSYMIAISNEKTETKIKKVTFKITEEKEKLKVISEPKLTDFSIT